MDNSQFLQVNFELRTSDFELEISSATSGIIEVPDLAPHTPL